MRELGVTALGLWEAVLELAVGVTLLEDDQPTAINTRSGKFPKLKHVQRMHGVNLRWLYDGFQRGTFTVKDCQTQKMAADMFTKHFTSRGSWDHAIRLLGFRRGDFTRSVRTTPAHPVSPCIRYSPVPSSSHDLECSRESLSSGSFVPVSSVAVCALKRRFPRSQPLAIQSGVVVKRKSIASLKSLQGVPMDAEEGAGVDVAGSPSGKPCNGGTAAPLKHAGPDPGPELPPQLPLGGPCRMPQLRSPTPESSPRAQYPVHPM